MPLSKAERETTIRWDEEERVVHVWSASPVTWRKMARIGVRPKREEGEGKFYELALTEFRWGVKQHRPGAGAHLRKAVAP